jgi:histidyl-tRNA synthetase
MANLGFVMRPAPGVEIESGIAKINDALSWNDTEDMTDENKPKLYISDQCDNTITSMLEYTGQSRAEHFKDQIDCIRYLMVSGADHITPGSMVATGGGGY